MYIVISKDDKNYHTGFCALGHEIHLSRFILFDMFYKKYIDDNCIIVTVNEERKFLYNNVFKNIISYNKFTELNINNEQMINIWPFMVSLKSDIDKYYIDLFKKQCHYPIENIINNKLSRDIDYLLKNINYPEITDCSLNEKKFFMLHHRVIFKLFNNNKIDINYDITNKIIDFLSENFKDTNIIIFCSDKNIIFKNNVKCVNCIALYASLLKDINCLAIISELSGGGEFAQYCHNNIIYHYTNSYDVYEINSNLQLLQSNLNLHDKWNLHGTTNAVLKRFKDINKMFENIIADIK